MHLHCENAAQQDEDSKAKVDNAYFRILKQCFFSAHSIKKKGEVGADRAGRYIRDSNESRT
jgi:hypothetical protein